MSTIGDTKEGWNQSRRFKKSYATIILTLLARLLVLLGTLISLLMLGLGPFVQQSVSIIPNDVPESTRAASITRGVYYNLTSASDDYILGDEPSSDTNGKQPSAF